MKWEVVLTKDDSEKQDVIQGNSLMQKRALSSKWFINPTEAQVFNVTVSMKWQVELLSCLLQEFSCK